MDFTRDIANDDVAQRCRSESTPQGAATRAEVPVSEEMLRLALHAGRIAGYRRDLRAGLTYGDGALRDLLGVPPGEGPLTHLEWTSTVLPEDQERLVAVMTAVYRERRPVADLDLRIQHPERGLRYIEARSRVEYDATGRPFWSVGVVIDVTERRAIEAELRASQELLRLSLEVGNIGSFRRDHAASVIHCELGFRQMHGLPLTDQPVPDSLWFSTLLPEDGERLRAETLANFAARRETAGFEYRVAHPVNGIRHMETRSRIEYDAHGHPLRSVGVVIDVTERRRAEARISHLAHHDPLTNLPNRTLFRDRLDEALVHARKGERFAVCCVDLDHFKEVNDTLGHAIGDVLLQAVAGRLNEIVRSTDTLARLGGDEFAIIQRSIKQTSEAEALAGRITAALAAPFAIEGHRVQIGASVGLAVAGEDGLEPGELLRKADMALYRAKADGRGRSRFFATAMEERVLERRALELGLRQACAQGEFELFYQPLVRVAGRSLAGFEALLRWRHPTRGLVAPDRFIPLAEETGLIVPIGSWVIREACREASTWPERVRVAVNLSAVQFTSETLVEDVRSALRASGLTPGRLELEITETVMLQDTDATLDILRRLKAIGIGIVLDDFGSGYSSLSYLQRFPFDKVKIDRSFTTNIGTTRDGMAIVDGVIGLCSRLRMRTTAEGVENERQLEALARSGCMEAQGYLFSRPRPSEELPAIFQNFSETRAPRAIGPAIPLAGNLCNS